MGKYQYRSPHKRETVYDPDDAKVVLCEFADYKFETDDKALAEKLEHHPNLGFEPWSEISEEDIFVLADGSEVPVKSLPEEIRRTIVGMPKRLIKTSKKVLARSEPSVEVPKFVCAKCDREFPSQSALNGHMAKHAKEEKA